MAFPFATISKRRFVASQHIVFCSHRDRYHGTSVRGLIRVRCTRSRRRAPGFRTVPSHPPSCHSVTYFQTTSTLWPPAVERHQREHNATTRHSVCTFQPDSALFLAFVWLVGRHFADLVARHSHTHPYTHPPPEKKRPFHFCCAFFCPVSPTMRISNLTLRFVRESNEGRRRLAVPAALLSAIWKSTGHCRSTRSTGFLEGNVCAV